MEQNHTNHKSQEALLVAGTSQQQHIVYAAPSP